MKRIDYQTIRNRVRSKRIALGLSQEDLGLKVGLTQTQISNIENREDCITITKLDILEALSIALDIELEYLLGFDNSTEESSINIHGVQIPLFIWEDLCDSFPLFDPEEIKTSFKRSIHDENLGDVNLYVLNIYTKDFGTPAEIYDSFIYLVWKEGTIPRFISISGYLTDLSSIYHTLKNHALSDLFMFNDDYQFDSWLLFQENQPDELKANYNPKKSFIENALIVFLYAKTDDSKEPIDFSYCTHLLYDMLDSVYPNAPFILVTDLHDQEYNVNGLKILEALKDKANIHLPASNTIDRADLYSYHFKYK